MNKRAIFLAACIIFIFTGIAYFATKFFFPEISNIDSNLLLIISILGGVTAFFSGLKDLTDFLKDNFGTFGNRRIFSSRYNSKYLQHMVYRHRNFDVKGLTTQGIYTLELAQVFVELSIAPQPPHEVSPNPIDVSKQLKEGRHTIWDFLNQGDQNFVIIGPPGSGKTTLLKHLTLILAGKKKHRKLYRMSDSLPVLISLRNHVDAIISATNKSLYSLEEAIKNDLQKWNQIAPDGWFREQLERGHCLVMFDGLDEVGESRQREQVVAWVEQKMGAYGRNQFLITSRPYGYQGNPLSGVSVLSVQPFNREQQQRFVENWYLANEIQGQQKDDDGVRMDAVQGAADLMDRLFSTPKLAELAVNPLLLTMIATVHKYRSSLPGRRVELYAEICEVFLGKRQRARGLELDLTPAQRQRVLQQLAWYMMASRQRELNAEKAAWVIKPVLLAVDRSTEPNDFLKIIEHESGLLVEKENGKYAFAHLTFQEYLAAAHAQDQQLLMDLLPHVSESWWHETLLLYASRADATPIIEASLSRLPDIKALLLAIACADEAREIRPDVQQQLDKILDESLEGKDKELINLVVSAKLQRRLQQLVRISDLVSMDISLVTCAEYQLFLDEMRAQNNYYHPDHWQGYHYPTGASNQPILGIRPSFALAFCNWLESNTNNSRFFYRLPTRDEMELAKIQSNAGIEAIGYWSITGDSFSLVMINGERPTIESKKLEEYFAQAQLLDHSHLLDRARALDLALDRALARSSEAYHTTNTSSTFDHALNRALDEHKIHDQARALDFARDLALDLVLDIGLKYTLNLVRGRTLASDLARAHDNALSRLRGLGKDRFLILDLKPTLSLDSTLNRAISNVCTKVGNRALAFDFLRYVGLFISENIFYLSSILIEETSWSKRQSGNFRQWQIDMKILGDKYLGFFVDLCILEERINGNFPALEGIRIVRELKDNEK